MEVELFCLLIKSYLVEPESFSNIDLFNYLIH